MKFKDLTFEPHSIGNGVHALTFFDNGYGASVVKFNGSYGNESGLYELAVLAGDKDDWSISYDTPITNDVIGHLSESAVTNTLREIAALSKL